MPEPLNDETAHVIVVVRMAEDIHHLLGKVATATWALAGFFALSFLLDLTAHDWMSAAVMAVFCAFWVHVGRETWARRRKYAAFVKAATTPRSAR